MNEPPAILSCSVLFTAACPTVASRRPALALKYLQGPFDVYIPYILFILRNADLRADRYADARLRYEQFYPALAEDDPMVHRANYRAAIDLSVVLERMYGM